MTEWTTEKLRAFTDEVAEVFNAGQIAAPVHLAGGNEEQLIEIFRDVRPEDWVCGSWRSHYHCLLKGVPPSDLMAAIVAGRSIALCFPDHRVICSAIVGGIMPIALGIAWGIKRRAGAGIVHCFVGDMTNTGGLAAECRNYAYGHGLPIRWIVENNRMAVATDTEASWGEELREPVSLTYEYELDRPHVGTGKWVSL